MQLNDKDRSIIIRMIMYCDDISSLMEKYGRSFHRYISDISFQYSCGMCLIQIGELAGKLSDETIAKNPSVAWRAIKAMRNVHAHDYGNIDFSMVWDTLENDVPDLRMMLSEILAGHDI